jgi:dTDP-4-amino-4,6-dideoxygalactose transaminase
MQVKYSYLGKQFADIDPYLEEIRGLVRSGDFTLGAPVWRFEERFAQLCGLPYAVGVGSGTDALILSLKILNIGPGDEVITAPNTFVATVGAIAMVGARPVFVDNNDEYNIDVGLIEDAISSGTRAILPVHLTGNPADMPAIMAIAQRHNLAVVEDASQAILASIDGQQVGAWGDTACFSLHPLKNLNVWGDGGVVVTRSTEHLRNLRLIRNHGLANRDEVVFFGQNSRLDSLQAVVANRLLDQLESITEKRIANASRFDKAFTELGEYITVPTRKPGVKQVFHTYVVRAVDRDKLLAYLLENGIEAKVHYPIPLHLQKAAEYLGYRPGDFPVCEDHCRTIISLPVHQHLSNEEIDYVIDRVYGFYLGPHHESPRSRRSASRMTKRGPAP